MMKDLQKYRAAGERAGKAKELRAPFSSQIIKDYIKENPDVGSGVGDRMEAWLEGYDEARVQMLHNQAITPVSQ